MIRRLWELDPTLIVGAGLAIFVWLLILTLHIRDYFSDKKRHKSYRERLKEE